MDTEEPQESWGSVEDLSVATAGLSAESWEIRSHRRMGGLMIKWRHLNMKGTAAGVGAAKYWGGPYMV